MSLLASLLLTIVALSVQAESCVPAAAAAVPAPAQDAEADTPPPTDQAVRVPADDAPSEPRGRLLFTRQLAGRDDLFVLHLPEGRIEQLSDHAAKDSHGAVAPDARQIAFCSERRGWWKIWLMDADGSGGEQLTHPASGADYAPCWSPDGQDLAYVSGSLGNGDVLRLDLEEGVTQNLTDHPARDNFPAWSPDGNTIVFASDRADDHWALYAMPAEGGAEVRQLTQDGEAIEPAWFPAGDRLVWQGYTDDIEHPQLWTQQLRDQQPVGAPRRLSDGTSSDERPAVSPDGRWIAFESDRAGGSQLFLIPAEGGSPRQLTDEGYCYAAAWWPDSEDLAPQRPDAPATR
ncbi:MAG: hypothetical protein DHS20C15_26750 [Planctomycetota bacterium]|nr:MAG: hypothetical protein DHS20C15_26750 [Planctomycetota bacterium]